MYSQWHTTALCSPTRSTLLTGRNHHLNGMAASRRRPTDSPAAARPHPAAVRHHRADPAGRRLEHLLAGQEPQRPRDRTSPRAASRKTVAARKGFDRYYGFLGGETNQWYPDLVEDNHFIDPPYTPGGGLSPLQGSGRPGHQDDPRPEGQQPLEAVVHVVSARAPTTPRTMPRRNTSTNTRASSTTATRPTASGSCRA